MSYSRRPASRRQRGRVVAGPAGELLCFFCDATMKVRFCSSVDGMNWTDPGAVPAALSKQTPTAVVTNQGVYCMHPGQRTLRIYFSLARLPDPTSESTGTTPSPPPL